MVAPAFLTLWVAREFSPVASDNRLDANTLAVQALTIAILVLAVEFVVLALVAIRWPDARLWGGLPASAFLSTDPMAEVRSNPEATLLIASIEYFIHISIFAVLGFTNPPGRLLQRRLSAQGLRSQDPFTMAVDTTPKELSSDITYVLLRLHDGSRYTGTFQAASVQARPDGSRDLFLQEVQRGEGDGWTPVANGPAAGLIVNTRDVVALELSYGAGLPTGESGTAAALVPVADHAATRTS